MCITLLTKGNTAYPPVDRLCMNRVWLFTLSILIFISASFFRLFSKTLLFRPFKISRQSNRKEHEIQEIFLRALQHIFNLFQLFDKQIIDLKQL